jgi:hypothetical protein
MAANEALDRAEQFTITASGATADNGAIGPISGEPLIWGLANSPSLSLGVVCETSYTPPGSLVPDGNITIKTVGAFFLTVAAKTSINPGTGKQINPGDPIYADGGTLDTTDGILFGITLNCNSSTGWLFGRAMDALASGTTGTIRVRIGGK